MKKINFAILNFPGTNCERDCFHVISKVLKQNCKVIWHNETSISKVDCVVVPGGFSYGDYLRTGSIASQSRISKALIRFANQGGSIIGICNGFQILTECKLLEGALIDNCKRLFICKENFVKIENKNTPFTKNINKNVVQFPIAHAQGRFYTSGDNLKRLEDNNQIVFKYAKSMFFACFLQTKLFVA